MEYAHLLQGLWQELHQLLQCIQMKCVEDAAILKRFIEKEHIYEFLTGLNIEFDLVRVQILGNEDLLPLNEVISIMSGGRMKRSYVGGLGK